MTHLPECWLSDGKFDAVCMCDRLRACEQRVRKDEQQKIRSAHLTGIQVSEVNKAYVSGYERALDAARKAVAALPFVSPAHYGKDALIAGAQPDFVRRDVLAAIDALREKR